MINTICPLKEIPIKGGATLKVNGGFKLNCIGDTCDNFNECLWREKQGV